MSQTLVIGTRGSKLALTQTEMMAAALRAAHPGLEVRTQIISTKGDRILDVALSAVGDKGLFVKELEVALLEGSIDLAVHSGKDLPSALPEGLILAAFPERADPRDVIVLPGNVGLKGTYAGQSPGAAAFSPLDVALPAGARVGTSSLRRACQLRALRPDLQLHDVRGNVDTRLRKLAEGEYDALVLAAAGLKRLGMFENAEGGVQEVAGNSFELFYILDAAFCVLPLPATVMLPAVAQGALAIEARADDTATLGHLAALDHAPTRAAALAERALLRRLEGGCQVPIAAFAGCSMPNVEGSPEPVLSAALHSACSTLHVYGLVGSLDGTQIVRGDLVGSVEDPEALGLELAEELLARGADTILKELRVEHGA